MMALARSQCLAPIMLKIIGTAAGMAALLPWDAGYGAADGEGVPCDDRLRARFAKYPTRIEFDPSTRKPRES
jgi:hypothetical protein